MTRNNFLKTATLSLGSLAFPAIGSETIPKFMPSAFKTLNEKFGGFEVGAITLFSYNGETQEDEARLMKTLSHPYYYNPVWRIWRVVKSPVVDSAMIIRDSDPNLPIFLFCSLSDLTAKIESTVSAHYKLTEEKLWRFNKNVHWDYSLRCLKMKSRKPDWEWRNWLKLDDGSQTFKDAGEGAVINYFTKDI
jgi:hypothetical protein